MKTKKIKDKDLTLAIIIKSTDWEKGLNFVSEQEDYQQVGFWGYDRGKKLVPHIHLVQPRQILQTQEVLFIKKGLIRVDIYNEKEEFFKSIELEEGDVAIFLRGGHGYEVLENETKVLEIKNGPYVGSEKDRKKIWPVLKK